MKSSPVETNGIERLNPLTKFSAALAMGVAAIAWPDCTLGMVMIVIISTVAVAAGMGRSYAKLMLGFGVPAAVLLLFIQGLYSPNNHTVLIDFGFAQLGLEGTMYALKIIVTVLVFLGGFVVANTTTYPGRLAASLTAAGCSPRVGYLILASLNVVPQMQRRMAVIQQAQAARGVSSEGGLVNRVKAYMPVLGPVVLSSLTDAQERGMTLETRGFSVRGSTHTSYVRCGWRKVDTVVTSLFIVTCGILLGVGILMQLGYLPWVGV